MAHGFFSIERRLKLFASGKLVPVVVRRAVAGSASSESSIEVAIPDGVTLRVPATVDRDWLVGLLQGLRAC